MSTCFKLMSFLLFSNMKMALGDTQKEKAKTDEKGKDRARYRLQYGAKLFIDDGIPTDVQQNLKSKGHALLHMPFFSSVQVVQYDANGFLAASDPRKGGMPAGW